MTLLTTIQVRAIMRKNGGVPIYTNKTAKDTSDNRRVKCYYKGNAKMLHALVAECGRDNVTLTKGGRYWGAGPGVTVKCILE